MPPLPGLSGEKAARADDKVTVIALYPSVGTIRDLMTLRQGQLIDIRNLEVVGVYHTKEITDYGKSQAFMKA